VTDRAQFQAEIEKLVASQALHGSEVPVKLLRYLESSRWSIREHRSRNIKLRRKCSGGRQNFVHN